MKRWLKRGLVVMTAVLFVTIIGLEIATRTCTCSNQVGTDLMEIKICGQEHASYTGEELVLLESLRADRTRGVDILEAAYREAMDMLVEEIDQELLGPANGVVCGIAYVRSSLPFQAKLFVKRHEFEHLFQDLAMENIEMAANIAAAKEYPVGLLQTIAYSLLEAKKGLGWCCFLISSWHIFKIYFLGIGN